jgi:hypothetical protein
VLKVVAFAERRGSADDARALCEALAPPRGSAAGRLRGADDP